MLNDIFLLQVILLSEIMKNRKVELVIPPEGVMVLKMMLEFRGLNVEVVHRDIQV